MNMLHVWADMHRRGLCHPFFDSKGGMVRCLERAFYNDSAAMQIAEQLLAESVRRRLR